MNGIQDFANMFVTGAKNTVADATGVTGQIQQIRADVKEGLQTAETVGGSYIAGQFFLQLVSTVAIVVIATMAVKNSRKP